MNRCITWCAFWLIFLSVLPGGRLSAQQRLSPEEIEAYKKEVKQLISYLEFNLNILGDPLTTSRQKNTIISESYKKIFRDGQVQIEDDLAPYRSTVTNKDVQSYLQDIDFFFSSATFSLNVEAIDHSINDFDQHYFLARLTRTLNGTSVDGNPIENTQPRFIEVNLDETDRELKIVSIYTTKFNELAGVSTWWNDLPLDWKLMFAKDVPLTETLSMQDALRLNTALEIGDTLFLPRKDTIELISSYKLPGIMRSEVVPSVDSTYYFNEVDTFILENPLTLSGIKNILDVRDLDLHNKGITDLRPISKMTRLRSLDVSQNPITDLSPVKSLTLLKSLNCAQTQVADLSPVQFAPDIRELNFSDTQVEDLAPIQFLNQLVKLSFGGSKVTDISPLSSHDRIKELILSHTQVSNLESLRDFAELVFLDLSETAVSDLGPVSQLPLLEILIVNGSQVGSLAALSEAPQLQKLYCEHTAVSSLDPLLALENLTNIYCDKSQITEQQALEFMRKKPQTLVTYKSDDLLGWWNSLSDGWKKVIGGGAPLPETPPKAMLQELANRTELNIKGNEAIRDLSPISAFQNLEVLNCDNTPISSLQALVALSELRIISVKNTGVRSLEPLRNLQKLEYLDCSQTSINTLLPLEELENLQTLQLNHTEVVELSSLVHLERIKRISCEHTAITKGQVLEFLAQKPETSILFHQAELTSWWQELSEAWKDVFKIHVPSSLNTPSSEHLHQMEMLTHINIEGNSVISDIRPVSTLQRLVSLQLTRTQVADLTPLKEIPQLKRLTCSQGPLRDLSPLSSMQNLEYLDVANTPIEEMDAIKYLATLENLNCSGTQIKDLKALSSLTNLRSLDFSNTRVKNIKPLSSLTALKSLTCYNTRVPSSKVDNFKESHPDTHVVYY